MVFGKIHGGSARRTKRRRVAIAAGTLALCFIAALGIDYSLNMSTSAPVQFFDRESGRLETEAIFGEKPLRWVYETHLGQIALWALIRRAAFSEIYGVVMSRPASREKIAPFCERFGVNVEESAVPVTEFASFNDFFSRRLKPGARPVAPAEDVATLPADGRHLAFPKISAATRFYAKGQRFDLEKFLGDAALAAHYADGTMVCSRLCPTDYHRFHFPVAGTPAAPRVVNGALYSVNPIALSKNLAYLWENKRVVVEIDSPRFGKVLQVLVGATNVGTIVPTYAAGTPAEKGAELGYFRFGGSFIATIFEPGKIRLADDLCANSAQGVETFAKMGTELGKAAAERE